MNAGRRVGTPLWRMMVLTLLVVLADRLWTAGVITTPEAHALNFALNAAFLMIIVTFWLDLYPLENKTLQALLGTALGLGIIAIGTVSVDTMPREYAAAYHQLTLITGLAIGVSATVLDLVAERLEEAVTERFSGVSRP